MQEIYIENIGKIIPNKKKLEKELSVKITNKGKIVFVNGQGDKEYIALKVIEALNLGFSAERALLLKDENFCLHILNIKDLTKRKNLKEIRARIIGKRGGALKTMCDLSDCLFSLDNNRVGIIGHVEDIEQGIQSMTRLIQGSRHANIYAKLEKIKHKKKLERFLPVKKDN